MEFMNIQNYSKHYLFYAWYCSGCLWGPWKYFRVLTPRFWKAEDMVASELRASNLTK